jgi:adenine phosphoribosyltransferase
MSMKYSLEYASHDLEMHQDSIGSGTRAVIVDDVLATGGTAKAAAALVEQLGGIVAAIIFLIEIDGLGGKKELENYNSRSLLTY